MKGFATWASQSVARRTGLTKPGSVVSLASHHMIGQTGLVMLFVDFHLIVGDNARSLRKRKGS